VPRKNTGRSCGSSKAWTRVDRVIQATSDLEQMIGDVLDVVLATFRCDRAWLVYPYDPAVDSHQVRIERTRPEYVGASSAGVAVPDELEVARLSHAVLGSSGPVRFDPESQRPVPPRLAEHFGIKSMIVMAVYPKVGKPYMFELHQCSHPAGLGLRGKSGCSMRSDGGWPTR